MEESFILSQFDQFIESGLVLYDDKQEKIEHIDGKLKFQFCLTSALVKKPTIQTPKSEMGDNNEPAHQRRDGSDIHTAGFEIGDIGSTHFLVANKFSFARPHLMLLTFDGYQRQYEPLHENDLEAAWSVLSNFRGDYVAFYNCGQDGGCSRLHKHIQFMPMPRNTFASFLDDNDAREPNVPFQWFYHRFSSPVTLQNLTSVYTSLLNQATEAGEGLPGHIATLFPGGAFPHNMILTKRWMIVLPRRRGAINKEAGANAMGMIGYIAVATKNEIDSWVRLGLTDALRELGVPK